MNLKPVLRTLMFFLSAWICTSFAYAQTLLIKDGKTKVKIILKEDIQVNKVAANLFQSFFQKITSKTLPIVINQTPQKGDILIGGETAQEVTEDGFSISTKDGILRVSGKDNGVVYGIVTLLEQYLGVDYWGENEYSFTPQKTIILPLINKTDNPAFRYRQTQCYAIRTDSVYKWWNRLEEPDEVFAAGYWVHTFDKLLPSSVYGKEHPEYYSYFKGKRHPGKASQWCLSNPEVFEIVAQRVDSIFKANPDKHIMSVSQNDGNYTNCTCDACKAIDDREEALSGSIITFLNKLAARFPDKEFSTLAYLYTMNPPKHVKPLPNVNIMLCDIDCDREVTLTENASGRQFVKAMEGWSAITDNIFVWDYGINFDNYLAPFPNFHILQDNIRLFKKNHATMHFSQIAGSRGGDFAELRAYLVSKLMWNPEADVDSLMQYFLHGYYGEAAPYLYQYIKVMEGALIGSGQRLWIYDSPVSHKYGMLKPTLMRRYNDLFDLAEKAVEADNTFLKRVQRARLPLQYSELEIARTETEKDLADIDRKLALFEERVKEFNVPTLNERSNSPIEYCELYRKRYMPQTERSLALGAKVSYIIPPTGKYAEIGKTALVDGLFGGATFVDSWVGWEGTDGAFILDLGEEKEIHSVETDFLHQIGAWILFPLKVTYSYSADGEQYTFWGTNDLPEERFGKVGFRGVKTESATPIKTRYVKVEVTGTKECPTWHYGVGHPSWFFIDEVIIK
ncbi:DUF4838 domain-containing protein [uncultured Bacteroides sp.]|jgi:hypothetical protein|uniref:DUF4838 domain-containing protein n=1 Tax=uncultured Bacteroides sp. TaxID=162156 RepID=UPI00258A15FA|nr:DUF4838 domain-containing protein [uncultured Bacteroides sp.]